MKEETQEKEGENKCFVCGEKAELYCGHCGALYCDEHYAKVIMTGNCCRKNEDDYSNN